MHFPWYKLTEKVLASLQNKPSMLWEGKTLGRKCSFGKGKPPLLRAESALGRHLVTHGMATPVGCRCAAEQKSTSLHQNNTPLSKPGRRCVDNNRSGKSGSPDVQIQFLFHLKVRIKTCSSQASLFKDRDWGHPSPVTGCVTLWASVSLSVNGNKESLLQRVIVRAGPAQTRALIECENIIIQVSTY